MADLLTARCAVKLLIALLAEDELKDILHGGHLHLKPSRCAQDRFLTVFIYSPTRERTIRSEMTGTCYKLLPALHNSLASSGGSTDVETFCVVQSKEQPCSRA